jgi:hypothetical protein
VQGRPAIFSQGPNRAHTPTPSPTPGGKSVSSSDGPPSRYSTDNSMGDHQRVEDVSMNNQTNEHSRTGQLAATPNLTIPKSDIPLAVLLCVCPARSPAHAALVIAKHRHRPASAGTWADRRKTATFSRTAEGYVFVSLRYILPQCISDGDIDSMYTRCYPAHRCTVLEGDVFRPASDHYLICTLLRSYQMIVP